MSSVDSVTSYIESRIPGPTSTCAFCGKDLSCELSYLGIYLPCNCEKAIEHAQREYAEETRVAKHVKVPGKFDDRMKGSGIGERFKNCTLENYAAGKNKEALAFAYELVAMFPRTRGLTLSGDSGVGKTHLACGIAKKVMQNGHGALFGTVPTLLSSIRAGFNGGDRAEDVMKRYKTIALLVLDDFGKEKPSEWVEEAIYEIINARYEAKLVTIVTTNISSEDVMERYRWNGKAILSRLAEMNNVSKIVGNDYRLAKTAV